MQLRPKDHPDRISQWRKQVDADMPSWRTAERSCSSLSVRVSYIGWPRVVMLWRLAHEFQVLARPVVGDLSASTQSCEG